MSARERFTAKIAEPDVRGCWHWTGCVNAAGYGRFKFQGRVQQAHRVAYELLVDVIPEGLQLDHLCRNRSCVNPEHLEPVTQRVNILRGEGRGAKEARQTHCIRGHSLADAYRDKRGKRRCRPCTLTNASAYKRRKRADARELVS